MHLKVIWDHDSLTVWRGDQLLASAAGVEDAAAVIEFLLPYCSSYWRTQLTLFVDRACLDHRLESIHTLSKKLQRQLLEQRQFKHYGQDGNLMRNWTSLPLVSDAIAAKQELHLTASLPSSEVEAISVWARLSGVTLTGIFSLPAALAAVAARQPSSQGRIIRVCLSETTYLLAQDRLGNPLFFVRVGEFDCNDALIERAAQRLALYIEQDFGFSPELSMSSGSDEPLALLSAVFNLAQKSKLDLTATTERRRKGLLRFRIRACGVLIVLIACSGWQFKQFVSESRLLDEKYASLIVNHTESLKELTDIRRRIAVEEQYQQIIAFSGHRDAGKDEQVAASLIPLLLANLVEVLPQEVEVDLLDCQFDRGSDRILLKIRARPINDKINLNQEWQGFLARLERLNINVESTEITPSYDSASTSRFARARRIISFEMELTLAPQK